MIKVHILTICKNCDGQAYLPNGQEVDSKGQVYTTYAPCRECQGSGTAPHWISLEAFADLLEKVEMLQPSYIDLPMPTSQYQDSRESAGI